MGEGQQSAIGSDPASVAAIRATRDRSPDRERRSVSVTVRTVAAAAGVSATTVSRVLSGKGVDAISPGTRERVLAAVRALDYRPNSLAAGLRTKKTKTIGLIVPDITDSYFHVLARSIEDHAQEAGYSVIVCNTDRVPAKERRYVNLLREKQVDAVVFAGGGFNDDRHLTDVKWGRTKVLAVGPHTLRWPTIGIDNRIAIYQSTRHLASVGCRRIACLGGKPRWQVHQARLAGYKEALSAVGLEQKPDLLWPGNFTVAAGERAVSKALAAQLDFDGIVAFDDYAAVGAMRALRKARLRIPEDVAVIGCDDIPLAGDTSPPLSSIRFPIRKLGQLAMRLILGAGEMPPEIFLPHKLIIRDSSMRTSK